MLQAAFVCAILVGVNGKLVVNYKDVRTESGVVRGYVAEGGYYAYLGIPYAAPPVGDKRFKAPFPPEKWNGIFEATRIVKCPRKGEGDEDCLILNVFTPSNSEINLSVLVYIHGGSFLMGRGQTTGVDPLIQNNIVVVTINYRLGALGFLCLGTEDAPGNAGLKDQVAALKWVQSNIKEFGGDPSKVTIFGMSAGAASVELLVLSKATKGLFEYAIVESGASTPVWVVDPTPIDTAVNVANILDFPTGNLDILIKYYSNVTHEKLSKANDDYYISLIDGTFGFVPCVERNLTTQIPILTEQPSEILKSGNFNNVPIMFLFASSEGLYLRSSEYYEQNYKDKMEANFAGFLPADLNFDSEAIKNKTAKKVKRFYFGDKKFGADTLVEYLNYFGDSLSLHGILNSVKMHARHGSTVYLMEFSYKGKLGSYDKFYEDLNLAGHGDVVKYAILNRPIEQESDRITVERVSKLISNFVKSGKPNPVPSPLLPTSWPAFQTNMSYLLLGNGMEILEDPYRNRKAFWDQLYSDFRRPLKTVNPTPFVSKESNMPSTFLTTK